MKGGDDPLPILYVEGMLADGNVPFCNEIDGVVGLALLEDAGPLCIDVLIQIGMDNQQLFIRKATEHAVLAKKLIS